MTLRITTAALTAMLLAGTAGGQDIIDMIKEKYNPRTSLEADVVLEIHWKVRELNERKQGRFILAPGDKFRIELDNTTWVCNGQTFWQYNTSTGQAIIKRLLDVDLSSHPSQLFETYLQRYRYAVARRDENGAVLVWTADSTAANSFYTSITLTVDTKRTEITAISVIDRHGNISTYRFRKTRFGAAMPGSVFEFDIPKGAHVLDTRN